MTNEFQVGDQIAYIPDHIIDNDLSHDNVEFGFITECNENGIFCRYWYWPTKHPNIENQLLLRTVLNSEKTNQRNLVKHFSVPQELVNEMLLHHGYLPPEIIIEVEGGLVREVHGAASYIVLDYDVLLNDMCPQCGDALLDNNFCAQECQPPGGISWDERRQQIS